MNKFKAKGAWQKVHSAITATATSSAINCEGYNAILIQNSISGAANWTYSLTGSFTENGEYSALYEQANTGSMAAMSYQTNAGSMFLFKGVPDWVKVVATEDAGAETVSVWAQPINV